VDEFGRQGLAAQTAEYRKPTYADLGPHSAHHLMPSEEPGYHQYARSPPGMLTAAS
jgi:hypothetical protein